MLQSEVQAVTITKTIRKGKRLLPGQSYLSNPTDSIHKANCKDFDTPPGKRLVAVGSSAAAPHSGFDSAL